jgi:hypothetical protein
MNAPIHLAPIAGGFALGARHTNGQMLFRLSEGVEGLGRAGEVISLAVTPADVTVQTEELDTYLGGFKPFGFVVDEIVSKVVLVDKEAGQRRDLAKENAFEVVDVSSGRDGAIKQIDPKSNLASYRVQDYALASWIPWATENDAATLYNVRAREVKVFDMLTTTGNWASTNRTTLTTNFFWDNGSTKDPLLDLHTRIKASAQPVTDICMNPDVGFHFLIDTKVRDFMKQMLGDAAPSPEVAQAAATQGKMTFRIPGFPPIHICPAKKLNLSSGELDYVLADDVLLLSNQPGTPRDGNGIATSWTFRYRGRSGTGIVTNEYVPQGRGINGGTMFEMGYSEDCFVASNIAGGLIKDVLS